MESDDQTEVASGSGTYRRETREIYLNWCLEGATDRHQAKKIHSEILTTMLIEFPSDLLALDQRNQELQHTTNQEENNLRSIIEKAKFTFHSATSPREHHLKRWHCVHKVTFTATLSTLKKNSQVFQKMKDSKVYINEHHFSSETWDIAHIGFLQGLNIKHIHRHEAKHRIQTQLEDINPEFPKFELVQARVRSGQKQTAFHQTRAYEVQCARKDAKALSKMLTSGPFRKTMTFVPYAFKKRQPAAFLQAITNQNKELTDTWVVKIEGATDTVLEEIRPEILEQPGVTDIVPVYNGQDKGQWKILVNQKSFGTFRHWLGKHWPTMLQNITQTAMASIPETHPPMTITSAAAGDSDNESRSEDSYATAFTNAMSVLTADTTNELRADTHTEESNQKRAPPSFAEILRSPSPVSAVTYGSTRGKEAHAGRQSTNSSSKYSQRTPSENTTQALEAKILSMTKESKALKEKIETLVETVQKQAEQTQSLQQMLTQLMQIQNDQQIYGPPTPQRRKIDFNVAINAETEAFEADKHQQHQK